MAMSPQDHERVQLLMRRLEALEQSQPKPEELSIVEIARTAIADELRQMFSHLGETVTRMGNSWSGNLGRAS